MQLPLDLSIEQQFQLTVYTDQVKQLPAEQAQKLLLELMRQMMIKDNVIRHLLKQAI